MLWTDFGLKKNEEGEYEIKTNEELKKLYGESRIIGVTKSSRIRWVGYVWRSEKVLGKITRWRPDLKQHTQLWLDRVMKDLRLLGVENAKEMAMEASCCCS